MSPLPAACCRSALRRLKSTLCPGYFALLHQTDFVIRGTTDLVLDRLSPCSVTYRQALDSLLDPLSVVCDVVRLCGRPLGIMSDI